MKICRYENIYDEIWKHDGRKKMKREEERKETRSVTLDRMASARKEMSLSDCPNEEEKRLPDSSEVAVKEAIIRGPLFDKDLRKADKRMKKKTGNSRTKTRATLNSY